MAAVRSLWHLAARVRAAAREAVADDEALEADAKKGGGNEARALLEELATAAAHELELFAAVDAARRWTELRVAVLRRMVVAREEAVVARREELLAAMEAAERERVEAERRAAEEAEAAAKAAALRKAREEAEAAEAAVKAAAEAARPGHSAARPARRSGR